MGLCINLPTNADFLRVCGEKNYMRTHSSQGDMENSADIENRNTPQIESLSGLISIHIFLGSAVKKNCIRTCGSQGDTEIYKRKKMRDIED